MNTTGIQNYLSNVFHPVYTYDTTNSNFTPRLNVVNINTFSGNNVSVFRADVGDSGFNVYVGSNSGNPFTTVKDCRNVSAFGYGAGSNISNVSNSIYVGYYTGAGATSANNVISIGANAGGNGTSNIFLGTITGTSIGTGSNNIFLGHAIDVPSTSYQVRIGSSNKVPIAADISYTWVGLGGVTTPTDVTYARVDVSGGMRIQGSLGLNIQPGNRTLDVNGNFRVTDASGNILDFQSNGITRSTGGYVSIQSNISAGIGATVNVGTIKKGIFHISVVDQASSTNRAATLYFAWTTSNVTSMAATSNGDTSITTSSSNIQISNATSTKTYDYTITYFPLP